jgi:hypothetical protein
MSGVIAVPTKGRCIERLRNQLPEPSIGWSGFLPTIALEFELEIEGVALNELIDVLLQSSDGE